MKIKIIVPWLGKLPNWYPQFCEVVSRNTNMEWEVVTSWDEIRSNVIRNIKIYPPVNIAPRKICDYRPAFGSIFKDRLVGYDWWGWCDLDCVFGSFSNYLTEERLEEYDLITDHPSIVNGPFTVIKNSVKMRRLYQEHAQWENIFSSTEHVAFDEKGFTDVIKASDAKVLYLNAHHHDREPGTPRLVDGRLFVGNREILTHHFASAKRWPTWVK